MTKDADIVVLSQNLRLKDRFFRGRKVLQVIGGKFPAYCGDAAIFWALALGRQEDFFFSVIDRHRYFRHSVPVCLCPVAIATGDSIREIRLKGMQAVALELPALIDGLLRGGDVFSEEYTRPDKVYRLSTPTLRDYLKVTCFQKQLTKLPRYATKTL